MPDYCLYREHLKSGSNEASCLSCGRCVNSPILDTFIQRENEIQKRKGFGIAVDIGTTTIVMALLDLYTGGIIFRHSFINPQIIFGGDVISRVQAANDGNLENMRSLIAEGLIKGISLLLSKNGDTQIEEIVIAGNTVMIHLLLGFSCESLGVSPFKIKHTLKNQYAAKEIFPRNSEHSFLLKNNRAMSIRVIPWFSAYVGGDITSGLLSLLPEGKKRFLLLDLGTNGEIAFYNDKKLTVTSCAAGSAFEGQGGASNVISETAKLLREGKIDRTGLIAEMEGGGNQEKMAHTRKQVRGLQLAKSAIRSAVEILLDETGVNYESLEKVYLAGGIGQAVNVNDAVAIGVIPKELESAAAAAGNASLAGAVRYLISPLRANEDALSLLSDFNEINLGGHPKFNDLFIKYMFFNTRLFR